MMRMPLPGNGGNGGRGSEGERGPNTLPLIVPSDTMKLAVHHANRLFPDPQYPASHRFRFGIGEANPSGVRLDVDIHNGEVTISSSNQYESTSFIYTAHPMDTPIARAEERKAVLYGIEQTHEFKLGLAADVAIDPKGKTFGDALSNQLLAASHTAGVFDNGQLAAISRAFDIVQQALYSGALTAADLAMQLELPLSGTRREGSADIVLTKEGQLHAITLRPATVEIPKTLQRLEASMVTYSLPSLEEQKPVERPGISISKLTTGQKAYDQVYLGPDGEIALLNEKRLLSADKQTIIEVRRDAVATLASLRKVPDSSAPLERYMKILEKVIGRYSYRGVEQ